MRTSFDQPDFTLSPDELYCARRKDAMRDGELVALKREAFQVLSRYMPEDEISEDDIDRKADELLMDAREDEREWND